MCVISFEDEQGEKVSKKELMYTKAILRNLKHLILKMEAQLQCAIKSFFNQML